MNKNENLNRLKQVLTEHKDIDVYLENDYYNTFKFNGEVYQGQFGYMTIEKAYEAINGLLEGVEIKEAKGVKDETNI